MKGMLVAETYIEHVAHATGLPSHVVRERNLYSDPEEKTHFGMKMADTDLPRIMRECKEMSDYETRLQVTFTGVLVGGGMGREDFFFFFFFFKFRFSLLFPFFSF